MLMVVDSVLSEDDQLLMLGCRHFGIDVQFVSTYGIISIALADHKAVNIKVIYINHHALKNQLMSIQVMILLFRCIAPHAVIAVHTTDAEVESYVSMIGGIVFPEQEKVISGIIQVLKLYRSTKPKPFPESPYIPALLEQADISLGASFDLLKALRLIEQTHMRQQYASRQLAISMDIIRDLV